MRDNDTETLADIVKSNRLNYFCKCKNAILILKALALNVNVAEIKDMIDICQICLETHRTFTLAAQEVLTYCFFIFEKIVQGNEKVPKIYANPFRDIAFKCMDRIINPKCEDSIICDRLMICLGDFIWEAIIWSKDAVDQFVISKGVFRVLDVIEVTPFPYVLTWLGLLVDVAQVVASISSFVSWSSRCGEGGLFQLLSKLYREEERRAGDKTSDGGAICGFNDSSELAASTTLRNVRIKIHSILKIIREWGLKGDATAARYGKFGGLKTIKIADQIALIAAERYVPVKFAEIQKCQDIRKQVRKDQLQVLASNKKEEARDLANFYEKLRETKLPGSLAALSELLACERTAQRKAMLAAKRKQIEAIEKGVAWPSGVKMNNCHKTMERNMACTELYGLNITIVKKK